MWAVIEKTPAGYEVYTKKGVKFHKRKDALWKYLKKCDRVFVVDRLSFLEFMEIDIDDKIAEKVVDISEVMREYFTGEEYRDILLALEELGFNPADIRHSIGGLALQVKKLLPEKLFILSAEERRLADEAFYGGRAENFVKRIRSPEGKIVCYDINSSYPYVMSSYPYPDTTEKPLFLKNLSPSEVQRYHEAGYCGLCFIEAEENYRFPRLPVRVWQGNDYVTYYPAGKIEGYYTSADAVLFNDDECIVREFIAYPMMESPFKEYVTKLYHSRLELRKKGSKGEKVIKAVMNTMFGVVSIKSSVYSNRILGAFITAYQRQRLFRGILTADSLRVPVLYCDTDSLWVLPNGKREKLERALGVRKEKKFGAWDTRYDGVIEMFCVRPKGYMFTLLGGKTEYVWSGLPKNSLVLSIDEKGITYELIVDQWTEPKRVKEFLPAGGVDRRKFISDVYSVPFRIEEISSCERKTVMEVTV